MISVSKWKSLVMREKSSCAQRVQVVGAISAVELGQVHAQGAILENGEDAVADVLIERHPALERAAVGAHHARAEDGIGLAGDQRAVELREDFRCVLSVAMQQDDDVEALFDEVPIPGLLIAAVTQVLWDASARAAWAG